MIDGILKRQLERDEGRKKKAYRDSSTKNEGLGYWTIGVGHFLGSSPRMTEITEPEIDALLELDVEEAVKNLDVVFGHSLLVKLDAPRFRAMVNMMFNRGIEHVQDSTSITPAIKRALAAMWEDRDATPEWAGVAVEIIRSPWGRQLPARCGRLAKQFETGEDQ